MALRSAVKPTKSYSSLFTLSLAFLGYHMNSTDIEVIEYVCMQDKCYHKRSVIQTVANRCLEMENFLSNDGSILKLYHKRRPCMGPLAAFDHASVFDLGFED